MFALVSMTSAGSMEISNLTFPLFRKYAERHGLDFKVLDGGNFRPFEHPSCLKWKLHSVLEEYEGVIFFDADVLVHGSCPNLFEITPRRSFAAQVDVWIQQHPLKFPNPLIYRGERVTLQYPYFNGGVFVVRASDREIFNIPDFGFKIKDVPSHAEQTELNIRVNLLVKRFHVLDPRFNCQNWGISEQNALVRHLSGGHFHDKVTCLKSWLPTYTRSWGA